MSRAGYTADMIEKVLQPQSDRVYSIMRIVVGLAFAFHGVQKIFKVLIDPQWVPAMGSQGWFGGIIELVGGAMIAFGFFTAWAAFICSGTMAVAYIQFHWKLQFDSNFFPTINGGELALIYCFLFLYMACKGSGPWSVDAFLGRNGGDGVAPAPRPSL